LNFTNWAVNFFTNLLFNIDLEIDIFSRIGRVVVGSYKTNGLIALELLIFRSEDELLIAGCEVTVVRVIQNDAVERVA